MSQLAVGIGGSELPEKIRSVMSGAGEMILAGRFDGGLRSFDTDLKLTTQAGNASLAVKRTPMKAEEGVRGRRSRREGRRPTCATCVWDACCATRRSAGHGVAALRRHMADSGRIDGNLEGPRRLGRGDGLPLRLADPFGTRYRQNFTGTLRSDCDPLRMMLSGKADMNRGGNPCATCACGRARRPACHGNINRRDSISTIAMGAEMYAVGRWPDEMNGTLSLGGQYVYPGHARAT